MYVLFCRSAASLSTAPGKYVPDLLRKMMSSAVTTVEATDWSVSMRMDTPTLQSKEPLLQAVLASCAANLQWNECETSDTSATFIRYIHVHVLSSPVYQVEMICLGLYLYKKFGPCQLSYLDSLVGKALG